MKPFTIFIMLIILSFLPIYPNPKKDDGLNNFNPLVPAKVNLWKAMS